MKLRFLGAGALACLLVCSAVSAQTLQQAEALWRAHDYPGTASAFDKLIAAHPDNAEYKVRAGEFWFSRYDYIDVAVKLFQEAIEADPKNASAYLDLAEAYADGFDSKANEAAQKALEIDPKLYHAHEIMARVALEDDNHKKAVEEANAALAINTNAVQAIAVRAAMDLLADETSSPWVGKIGKAAKGYELIAHFFVINRRYEDGIEYYKKAIAADPELWSAYSQLGVNLMRLGRSDEAYKDLELAFNNDHSSDASTRNSLRLLETTKDFVTFTTPTTILKMDKKEADALHPYFETEMKRAMAVYEKKYQFKLSRPVQVEVYPNHTDFEVRALGLPGLGALGVTFNDVIAIDSPSGRKPGDFHWASTLWHELSHVYILTLTNYRVPRWFTEGLAVHEETATMPDWGDRITPEIITAIRDKKLLPIADIDRGFVHPTFPAQVIVSYFEAGKMCDYIAGRWGESKLLDMAREFAKNRPTVDVVRDQLKIEPEAFDKDFMALIDKETGRTVSNFKEWTAGLGELNKLARAPDSSKEDIIAKGSALELIYPDYVEIGNPYVAVAKFCLLKGDKECALEQYAGYSKESGRDADSMKQYAKLLEEKGKLKEAEAALERLNFISPLDTELHDTLGNLYLKTNNGPAAEREFTVLVAMHPIDAAGSHYNLARAYKLEGQTEKAREEALTALEAAPQFRPAQKLLLEVSGEGSPK